MSDNKNKYFVVTTTSVVAATNQAEAVKAARSTKVVPGTKVLSADAEINRIPAITARSLATSN